MPKKKGYVTKYDGIYGVCTVALDKTSDKNSCF